MRQSILTIFLCCILLSGCAPESLPEETTVATESPTEPVGLYDPESALERITNGALRCCPLGRTGVTGVMSFGEGVLLFADSPTGTQLTLLEGDAVYEIARMDLAFSLSPENESLRLWEGGLSFFDPQARQTVVLDYHLQEQTRISAPKDLSGYPLLSEDGARIYYCTANGIWERNLLTDTSRCLKQTSGTTQILGGLWLEDTILECRVTDGEQTQILFLSVENGIILETSRDDLFLTTWDDRYYASFPDGCTRALVFGTVTEQKALYIPEYSCYLPQDHAALSLTQPEQNSINLNYYDLNTGLCTASLTLETMQIPSCFVPLADGQVCFLNYDDTYGCDTLYCWDTTRSPAEDENIYTGLHYTRQSPDVEGLAACQRYAEDIGSKYGIEVCIYKDAASVQPWDYDITYEHLTAVIDKELRQLDHRLSNYPEGFIQTLAGYFEGIRICIVRSITGTAESGNRATASGIQFMDGYTACIVLAAGADTEYSLYHEMCHLIDTVVITNSGAYDRWNDLNPRSFQYDYDYTLNRSRSSEEYLQPSNRSFIDTYSMSFPKEDRARIMEYAMTAGNEAYFVSLAMQSKLKLLCEGIREAFKLKRSPETFLWEQYLNTTLAYQG